MPATIVWFRQDLRLNDNPALAAAMKRGEAVVPLFVWDEPGAADERPGAASRWWLHHSLVSLDAALRERGSRLIIAREPAANTLERLVRESGATAVHWNRCYEPGAIARDTKIKAQLKAAGVEALSFNSALLHEPHEVRNKSGHPFRVFTPFWRHCLSRPKAGPVKLPAGPVTAPARWPASRTLDELELLPRLSWADGLASTWQPGEAAAQKRLKNFVDGAMAGYATERDRPAVDGTSALSPHLHFGEIGPRQVWSAVRALSDDSGVFPLNTGVQIFLTELGWREFAHHVLFHFPETVRRPMRPEFEAFPWRRNPAELRAWQRGRTGYPIVDAGMRQLWATGWMHNRVRMIVASFLVKHLRLRWQDGAAWFWDTLVDADLANNTLGWQWTAGCGADAAPFFRIFNPILQGAKFDPAGDYVRRWVPELANLSAKHVHRPWEAPGEILQAAGVRLGADYPQPMVDHAEARATAMAGFREMARAQG
ncbi:MAG TPA: deoxyribodipyrimidine photo-lyase [Lacunisphaera sp.]|nr:deoxyribodipyrimidine photo-lyase [Lacunisphaera sp.]